MSRRISLNLELNKKLSRASNHTPVSDQSIDSINSACSKFSSVTINGSRLKESIVKTREMIRSRLSGRISTNKSIEHAGEGLTSKPLLSPKITEFKALDKQSLTNKLNLKKYSAFVMRKMQENEFLNSLLVDRTPGDTNLIEMIEMDRAEPALLLALQLLCDVIVHCDGKFKEPN